MDPRFASLSNGLTLSLCGVRISRHYYNGLSRKVGRVARDLPQTGLGLITEVQELADLLGAGSNHLTDILKNWNDVLRDSSLGRGNLKPLNESKDGSAPRDAIRAVVRRRKTG
ncbi:hypothetical protein [Sphingobium sp. B11D3D]|uniref:hypothetical protein n=1 Tax=Sphingobium sp. B11D3D TaxID=2940576 RepID=UPI002225A5B4|nr:hypothetical protein [Sphingobium sp. B11D3D]MCW2368837.1 hypothetical protein [Sphingobium sp. B11D3D]